MTTAARTALITGGSKGIGRAIALRLAADGFDIWLNYRSGHEQAAAVQKAIHDKGRQCQLVCFDVADAQACSEHLAPLVKEQTPFAVVHNAGFAKDSIFALMAQESWEKVLAVHLNGFYNVTQAVLPAMLRKRQGRIVTISSTAGETGTAGQVNYSAAKAGLIGASRSLAVEIAKRNVLVNAVAPGFIDTDMLQGLPLETIKERIPLGRLGKPEDVAGLVSFLCSDDAQYITGQVLSVNGGIYT